MCSFATEIIMIVVLIFHQHLNCRRRSRKGRRFFCPKIQNGRVFLMQICFRIFSKLRKEYYFWLGLYEFVIFYACWNFCIPFGHTFMRIEIFIFHLNIFIFFVEYFICSRIFHPARLLKPFSVNAPFSPDPRSNHKCTQPISPWSIISILKHLLKIHIWKMFLLLFQRIFLCRNLRVFDLSIIIII